MTQSPAADGPSGDVCERSHMGSARGHRVAETFAPFTSGVLDIAERAEELVVTTEVRAIEEIIVTRRVSERIEVVHTTVRGVEVDVQPQGRHLPAATVRRALVVDDSVDCADMLCVLLGARGWSCSAAYTADQARTRFLELRPDAVLLDLTVAGSSGLELCRAWRATHPHLAILAVTGWARHELLQVSEEGSFDAIVTKPVDLDALLVQVERALTVRRPQRQ